MIDMKSKQSKITVSAILAVTIMLAGIFAFSPIDKATTVHNTVLPELQGAGGLDFDDIDATLDALQGVGGIDLDDVLANLMKVAEDTDIEALDLGEAAGTGDVTISVDGDGCLMVSAIIIAPTGAGVTQDIDGDEDLIMFEGGNLITIAGVEHNNIPETEIIRDFAEGGNELINALILAAVEAQDNDSTVNVSNPKLSICDDDTIIIDYTFDTVAEGGVNNGITFEAKVIGWITSDDDFTVTITED